MGRIVTGLILAGGWLLLLLIGSHPLFCLAITGVAVVALYEFLRMSSPEAEKKYIPVILIIGTLPLAAAALWGGDALATSLFLTFMLLIVLTVAAFPSLENSLLFLSRLWFAVFYIGFCGAHLILLHALTQGVYWLLFLTAITAFSDTCAYYVGRSLGKSKLYPALSPGKTKAGAVGGIIGGMLGGLVVAAFLFTGANLAMIALLGMLLSVTGIIGDLIESLCKRVAGVKDSGRILPGHGGVLDRCDSLLLTAPALYYAIYWWQPVLLR